MLDTYVSPMERERLVRQFLEVAAWAKELEGQLKGWLFLRAHRNAYEAKKECERLRSEIEQTRKDYANLSEANAALANESRRAMEYAQSLEEEYGRLKAAADALQADREKSAALFNDASAYAKSLEEERRGLQAIVASLRAGAEGPTGPSGETALRKEGTLPSPNGASRKPIDPS